MILNADLKQIEVICFAQLCKDENLIKLLNEGKDIHRYIASKVYNKAEEDVSDLERKSVKPGTFGIIYGNGAPRLSENTGQSVEWCKEFISTFYKLFPNAKLWHNFILSKVEKDGFLKLPTGSILKFKKHPAKYAWQKSKGIVESYNPPDIKNWPVQHFAFLILSILLGKFFREKALNNREKYLLINTVHDSIMLDCKPEYVEQAKTDILEITNTLPKYLEEFWNLKLLAPVSIDITTGQNWHQI